MSFKSDDMSYSPHEVLLHGRKLLAMAHEEYEDELDGGCTDDEACWSAFDGVTGNNFDCLAIIWAAGAVSLALESEDVRKAIEEVICFG